MAENPLDPRPEPEPVAILESPFCDELRSKKFFIHGDVATEADHYLDSTGHCWCFVTQQVVGPDGGRVGPGRCGPGRDCYKSVF